MYIYIYKLIFEFLNCYIFILVSSFNFRTPNDCLVVGSEDGMITVYEIPLEQHIKKMCLMVKAQKLNYVPPWLTPVMSNVAYNFILG